MTRYSQPPKMEHNDFIHGKIVIPEFIAKLIETRHFQRLKNIKQLGLTFNVFPGVNYTRYEHSIGTFHLASKMLECLEKNGDWITERCKNKKELERYKMFRQAVQIAALFHDIGHGPFSHTWEQIAFEYDHELVAIECIEDIFSDLDDDFLPEFRVNNNFGIELIKALVVGDVKMLDSEFPSQYRFIFEIVHNNECDLDVDKLDYLKRDTYWAKNFCNSITEIGNELDCIFFKSRIGKEGRHIEYRYEDYKKIYKLFETRAKLHYNFYRSPKVIASEYLLSYIIRNSNYQINSIPIVELKSRPKCTFLKFIDEAILKLIKDHYLFEIFKNIQVEFIENNNDSLESDGTIINCDAVIEAPGTKMPEDEKFHFYGNPDLKENIERQREAYIRECRFRLPNLK